MRKLECESWLAAARRKYQMVGRGQRLGLALASSGGVRTSVGRAVVVCC